MLIFGSTAIRHWFPDYEKEPKDLDYIAGNYPDDYIKQEGIEVHVPETGAFEYLIRYNKDKEYVDPDLLYTIMVSHMPWESKNGKWFKYLKDIIFLQNKGLKVNQTIRQAFQKEWELRFGNKSHISLNKATEMFFKDGVRREYDHDWLHEHFKIGDVPAYTRALKEDDKPIMCSHKFMFLPYVQQLHCALEEMFVVAFERNIPLSTAYKSLITKMTKGWFNTFMILNAEKLLDGFTSEKNQYKLLTSKLKERYNDK